jgi:transcriptional regulator with XRE-family HTH domain
MDTKIHPILSSRLARNVKAERERRKLTQRGLAALCGVSHAYITQIETEARDNVTTDTIDRLAAGLKIDPARLLKE